MKFDNLFYLCKDPKDVTLTKMVLDLGKIHYREVAHLDAIGRQGIRFYVVALDPEMIAKKKELWDRIKTRDEKYNSYHARFRHDLDKYQRIFENKRKLRH